MATWWLRVKSFCIHGITTNITTNWILNNNQSPLGQPQHTVSMLSMDDNIPYRKGPLSCGCGHPNLWTDSHEGFRRSIGLVHFKGKRKRFWLILANLDCSLCFCWSSTFISSLIGWPPWPCCATCSNSAAEGFAHELPSTCFAWRRLWQWLQLQCQPSNQTMELQLQCAALGWTDLNLRCSSCHSMEPNGHSRWVTLHLHGWRLVHVSHRSTTIDGG